MEMKTVLVKGLKIGDRIAYKGLTRRIEKLKKSKLFTILILDDSCLVSDGEKEIKLLHKDSIELLIFTEEEKKIYFTRLNNK